MSLEDQRKRFGRRNPPPSVQNARRQVENHKWDLDATKQYVRRNVWLADILTYRQQCRADGYIQPLKYLTFPGEHAVDIGFFLREEILENTPDGPINVAICDEGIADKVAFNL